MPGRLGLYDDYAKRVLALAQDEAWRVFHHKAIGPEHLMLAVLRAGSGDREGWIVPTLRSVGLDVVTARKALETLRGRGDAEEHSRQSTADPSHARSLQIVPIQGAPPRPVLLISFPSGTLPAWRAR